QEQVERLGAHANCLDERSRRRLGAPVAAVGLEEDGGVDSHRQRVLQLFRRGGGPERQYRRRAALRLDNAQRLFDGALLMRRDREAEERRIDRMRVGGERDARSRLRNSLDADEDVQLRTRVFSGSNSERLPRTATVTGYRSPMYWTSSSFPSSACSGGRYASSRCLPTDGPEPALVTYELRPFRSAMRSPSLVRFGLLPS